MSTAFEEAWATESTDERPSMSQDELIAEFTKLDELIKESGSRRREIGMALAGLAYEKKGTQNTVHLRDTQGKKVDVQFGKETSYVTDELIEVQKILGLEQFNDLFNTKIEFTAKKAALKLFLNTVWPSEQFETAKQMIQDATVVKDKTPYVSIP